MTFVHPNLFAVAMGAAVLPLLIYFVNREVRRGDAIIAVLRTAAILLLGGAMARPVTGGRPLVDKSERGAVTRIVVLDAGQSMGAVWEGVSAFEHGRAEAEGYLSGGPGVRCNLIVAGARADAVLDRPSANFSALRQELDRAAVRPERLDAKAALGVAGGMLGGAGTAAAPGKRELVIVSDFARCNWGSAGESFAALAKETRVVLVSAAPSRTPGNLAVVRAAARGRVEQGRPSFVDIDVANFSDQGRQVQVELNIGALGFRLSGICPSGATTTLSAPATFGQAGYQVGEARLVGPNDALAADDVRALVVHVLPPPTYALITRQSGQERGSSSFYVERALADGGQNSAPGTARLPQQTDSPAHLLGEPGGPPPVAVRRMEAQKVDPEVLAVADCIVLDHPGVLPAPAINLLAAGLRRGRGVLYIAAEASDASNLKMLEIAAGSDLKMPVEFLAAPAGEKRGDLFWQEVNAGVPPFSVFGSGLESLKKNLRFSRALMSRRLAGGLPEDVVASYSDRSAALVVTPCGAGQLGVLNVDLPASNLATSAAFVPLIDELAARLAGSSRGAACVPSGENFEIELPASVGMAAGLEIVGSPASAELGQITDQASGPVWSCKAGLPPGIYRVVRDHVTVFALASALGAKDKATEQMYEADLTPLDPDVVRKKFSGDVQMQWVDAGHEQECRDAWWVYLAAGCAGCLLLEMAAMKFLRE